MLDDKTPAMGAMPVVISVVKGEPDTNNIFHEISIHLVSYNHKKTFEIQSFPYVIGGKGQEQDVDKKIVSIDKKNNALVITNKGGEGYLKVNNHPVQSVILKDRDKIQIGSELFSLLLEQQNINIEQEPTVNNNIDSVDRAMLVKQAIAAENKTAKTSPGNIHILNENNHDHKTRSRKKKILFAVFTILFISIGIVAYKSYKTYINESKVFHITDNTNNKVTNTNKNNTPVMQRKNTGKTTPELSLPGKSVKTTDREKIGESRYVLKTTKHPIYKSRRIKTTREKILYEMNYSDKRLANAKSLYLSGRYNKSIQILDDITTNKRYRPDYRVIADNLKNRLTLLNSYYQNGNQAYESDDKDEAFVQWAKLLKQHKKLFPNKESFYTHKISSIVATEYELRGNQAYTKNKWGAAYHNWVNSVNIRPKSSVQQSINLMDSELKQLYRTGYRYETVNIKRALEYWKTLVKKAPKDHEYYIKAAAKIKWYEYTQ